MRRLALVLCFISGLSLAADSSKVLRLALLHAETTFDPAMASEVYSSTIIAAIMEPLLGYDYLARPPKLVPLTAAALPEIADDGRTYTFRIKPGILFASDPAFKGKPRELTAADYAYAIKRIADPALRSPNAFHVAGKIVGLDSAVRRAAIPDAKFDYETGIEGLEVVDRHTLRIRLTRSDFTFEYAMAAPAFSAVAREAVEAYGERIGDHPVGTGPYLLKSRVPGSRITLEANPQFRRVVFDAAPGEDADGRRIASAMRGKQLPSIGTVEFRVMEEPQARWLAIQTGELDIGDIPMAYAPVALRAGTLSPDIAAKGMQLSSMLEPNITFTAFNMRDPVVGGFGKQQVALRRAIAMAYSNETEIAVVRNGQAVELQMPIPPGVPGHLPGYRTNVRHDPALANALLDEMGYHRDRDGWRAAPDGKSLVLHFATQRDADGRANAELWKRAFDAIGIRVLMDEGSFADQIKSATACRHQIWSYGWFADYPDGDNFMQLLHGPNVHQSNVACYSSRQYDDLYAQSLRLRNSPARNALYERMARQAEADTPWRLHVTLRRNMLAQPWVIGYKPHPVLQSDLMYLDVERPRR